MNTNETIAELLVGNEYEQCSNIHRIEQLLYNIRLNEGVRFFPIGLVTLRGVDGVNITRPRPERELAMQINRRLVGLLYKRYKVDENRTVTHIRPSSALTLSMHTERFSPIGIGFIETASYALSDNQSLAAVARHGQGVRLESGYPPKIDPQKPPVPQSFTVEVHQVIEGEMPFQYLD